ncbi:MAG: hypothetical protein R3E79_19025 [Caldilineaceae bacterium]
MYRFLGYGSLLLVVGWLALSYGAWLPDSAHIEAPVVQVGPWFQQATVGILLLFVAIQLWLVYTTFRMLHRRRQVEGQSISDHFALSLFGELFWTALPVLLTIGLALAGYGLWASI